MPIYKKYFEEVCVNSVADILETIGKVKEIKEALETSITQKAKELSEIKENLNATKKENFSMNVDNKNIEMIHNVSFYILQYLGNID